MDPWPQHCLAVTVALNWKQDKNKIVCDVDFGCPLTRVPHLHFPNQIRFSFILSWVQGLHLFVVCSVFNDLYLKSNFLRLEEVLPRETVPEGEGSVPPCPPSSFTKGYNTSTFFSPFILSLLGSSTGFCDFKFKRGHSAWLPVFNQLNPVA